jgi:predicted nucleic acid-binding protein
MAKSSIVVIDAGVGVLQVIAGPLSAAVDTRWNGWVQESVSVCAPHLWLYETTSVVHKIFKQKQVSEGRTREALNALLDLSVELHAPDAETCELAFEWATRLDQYSAYDGFYLALAHKLNASFWTTDQRLANRIRQIGFDWVHWAGE